MIDMSHPQNHRKALIYLTLVIAATQFALMMLGLFDRLAFGEPTSYELLNQTLSSHIWTWLHGISFIAILLALYFRKCYVPALGSATGVLAAWSFLSLLWGLSTPTPVSLAGPILGGGVAALSYVLTISWARIPTSHERTE